jgi:hypothetical protein
MPAISTGPLTNNSLQSTHAQTDLLPPSWIFFAVPGWFRSWQSSIVRLALAGS